MIFVNIINWIKDSKNRRLLLFVFILIILGLLLFQCSRNNDLKNELQIQKDEAQRVLNNIDAKNSPLIQQHINDSTLLAEKQALKLTIDELKTGYSSLLIGFEKFKNQNPKVIEKITINNHETLVKIPVNVKLDSLGNGIFSITDSTYFADGNYRTIQGNVPFSNYHFKKSDSSTVDINSLGLYSKVIPGPANFVLNQKIKLKVGLFEDSKTKKITIGATTSYPGITFSQLDGADIINDDKSKQALQQLRKPWSIGFHIGYGATIDIKSNKFSLGPQVGIGLNYSPKWLQWGK